MKTTVRHLSSLALAVALSGCLSVEQRPDPWDMQKHISPATAELISKAFVFDVSGERQAIPAIADHHAHMIASKVKGAYLNPRLNSWWHPIRKLQTRVLMDASQVFDFEKIDEQYPHRLINLIRHFRDVQRRYSPPHAVIPALHFYLYAMEYHRDEEGNPVKEYTDMHVPNDYVIRLAQSFNEEQMRDGDPQLRIIPVASLHPYRRDFRQELAKLASQGVRFIKWLPPSMNIDLDKVRSENYLAMARHKMVLLSHTGHEHTIQTRDEHQRFGDPYKLMKALDCGANVVALHSGRVGESDDTDAAYFERFMDMMEKEEYRGRLFGEISVMTMGRIFIWRGSHEKLNRLIAETQPGKTLTGRMLNGSDYPIPAIASLNPSEELRERRMITPTDQRALDEVFAYNPLLFDFVLKRTVRSAAHAEEPVKGAAHAEDPVRSTAHAEAQQLPQQVFLSHKFYQTPAPVAEGCWRDEV